MRRKRFAPTRTIGSSPEWTRGALAPASQEPVHEYVNLHAPGERRALKFDQHFPRGFETFIHAADCRCRLIRSA